MMTILAKVKKNCFVDFSNEADGLTIELLMEKGFSIDQASAYLSKLNIEKLAKDDNGCKNILFNPELRLPPDRMNKFKDKKGVK